MKPSYRSPFRYPGGKTWLLPVIRQWLTAINADHLVEPFCGGASVSLTAAAEHLTKTVHMADLDPDIACVWRTTLQDNESLASAVENLGSTPEALLQASRDTHDRLHRALSVIVRNRISYGGNMTPRACILKKGDGRGLVSRWYPETLANRIRDIAGYADRMTFTEGDAFDILTPQNCPPGTCIFLDPPYATAGGRLYNCPTTDHDRLLKTVTALGRHWLLTDEDTPQARSLLDRHGVRYTAIPMRTAHNIAKHELLAGDDLSFLNNNQPENHQTNNMTDKS